MTRFIKNHSKKAGLRPGEMTFIGDRKIEHPVISIIDFDAENLRELKADRIEDCLPFRDSSNISWIDISGVHDIEAIRKIGEHFKLHPLVLEDIVNTGLRPKFEEGDDYLFISLKMIYKTGSDGDYGSEQVSIVFGENFILSFQEKEGDVFDPVRERIRKTIPRVRFMKSDYLAHALIDAVVDNYFHILEDVGERIEDIEEALVDNPTAEDLSQIHNLKRELILMRRRVWPLREVVGSLERTESRLINQVTGPYIRDLYEHVIQVIDTVETFRDMVSGLLDTYMSSVSNRMNEVMKVLTIIATIFIPLGFLAGVYGMNFDRGAGSMNMPELGLPFGYIGFWGITLLISGGLYLFFRRKGWL